jgi:hypothetical protein
MRSELTFTILLSLFVGGCFQHRQPKKVKEDKKAPNTSDPSKPTGDDGFKYGDEDGKSYGEPEDAANPNATQLPTHTPTVLAINTPLAGTTPKPNTTSVPNPNSSTQISVMLVNDSTTPWRDRVKITWIGGETVKPDPAPEYKLSFKSEKNSSNSVVFAPAIAVNFFLEGRDKPCHFKESAITEVVKTLNATCE